MCAAAPELVPLAPPGLEIKLYQNLASYRVALLLTDASVRPSRLQPDPPAAPAIFRPSRLGQNMEA